MHHNELTSNTFIPKPDAMTWLEFFWTEGSTSWILGNTLDFKKIWFLVKKEYYGRKGFPGNMSIIDVAKIWKGGGIKLENQYFLSSPGRLCGKQEPPRNSWTMFGMDGESSRNRIHGFIFRKQFAGEKHGVYMSLSPSSGNWSFFQPYLFNRI